MTFKNNKNIIFFWQFGVDEAFENICDPLAQEKLNGKVSDNQVHFYCSNKYLDNCIYKIVLNFINLCIYIMYFYFYNIKN